MEFETVGYSETEYEGTKYLKIHTLGAIEDGKGGGKQAIVVVVDISQTAKLRATQYPCIVIAKNAGLRPKKGGSGNQIAELVLFDIETKSATVTAPARAA